MCQNLGVLWVRNVDRAQHRIWGMAAVCGVMFGPPVEDVKAGACELTEGLLTLASSG